MSTFESEFRTLVGDAQSLARSERAQEFASEMVIKAKEYGLRTLLSERQLAYLCSLADRETPRRIVR